VCVIGRSVSIVGADWSTGKPQAMHSRNMHSISHFVSLSYIEGADYVHEFRRKMQSTNAAQGNVFI
jgi:hypothetical protein